MAVFDADKDISPGIVVSVPFFGGILALLMIGGTRISHFFSIRSLFSVYIISGGEGEMTIEVRFLFRSLRCVREELFPKSAEPKRAGTRARSVQPVWYRF